MASLRTQQSIGQLRDVIDRLPDAAGEWGNVGEGLAVGCADNLADVGIHCFGARRRQSRQPKHAQTYGSRIRHEDEKNLSAILMRILQTPR